MKPRTTGALAVLALAAVLTLALVAVGFVGVEAVYPVERAKQIFSRHVWSRISGAFRASEANAENVRLRREVATLSLVRAELDRLEQENARLRGALEYRARQKGSWLAAGILSEGGGAAGRRRTIRVDKGSDHGVVKNAVVVVPEGLVGRVDAVSPNTAEIVLLSDAGVKVACDVETGGSSKVRGVVSGGAEDVLSLRLAAEGATEPPPRSRVVTSGAGGIFPAGIEVGSYIGDGEVSPSVDFSSLEDVFIRCER